MGNDPREEAETLRHLPIAVGRYDLRGQISELRASSQYRTTKHAARTLFKRPEASVVLVVLAQGEALNEHRVDRPVLVQTLEGRIEMRSAGRTEEHSAGGLQMLDTSVVHDVVAREDSAILIMIPWPDPS